MKAKITLSLDATHNKVLQRILKDVEKGDKGAKELLEVILKNQNFKIEQVELS